MVMDWGGIGLLVVIAVVVVFAVLIWRFWRRNLDKKRLVKQASPIPPPQPEPAFPTSFDLPSQISLASDVGADYSRLYDLLAANRYQQADEETKRVMLWVARADLRGYLLNSDLKTFPCRDLRTIDQLWVQYSGGRFGLSVQKRIYDRVGGNYHKLGDLVGWRSHKKWLKHSDLSFSIRTPMGHLPLEGGVWSGWLGGGAEIYSSLMQRLRDCKI
ncbi:GUN4 domain-containing protein [Oscillatoria salina]|uniref:GUN4 domain-containing protein n=1 Tax=Oscillatoria salina TaxID=331517 RepID=UPI0013B7F7E3|nr:GUN4 domain-containing protein [Oscillatoria salina]MBZ8182321.1 GUN4 domain-containing protein [Oscillatoria salina IIICB1]NET89972.1 GUN4 domain-containing protein [Kamptonema sp. SIO1D9]